MPRPHCRRWIGQRPAALLYKPAGIPARELETVLLSMDELEAMRLVDAEGLDQTQAAEQMKISRATVGRLLASGRGKTAGTLVRGAALSIETGPADLHFYNEQTTPMPGRGRDRGCGCGRRHRGGINE